MTATISRVKLAKTRSELPPYRPGHWVVAGTPGWLPYPCTCWYSPCNYPKCPDRTRTEGAALPAGCCGGASGSHGESTEAPARYSNAPGFVRQPSRAREMPPARVVSSRVAEDLWGPPIVDAPPAWDALDEVSPVVVETWRPAPPDTNEDVPVRQHSEPVEGRRRSRVEHCRCPTPWDPPPPVLLVAETKTGPVRMAIALDLPRDGEQVDLRGHAEKLLAVRGYGLKGGWKDGRHALLPPEGRLKTRPGFLAEVFNVAPGLRESAFAVIDTPPEQGTGIHCPDCHRDWQNVSAYGMHRRKGNGIDWPRWAERCVDPGTIRVVPRSPGSAGGPASISRRSSPGQYDGAPLLKRGTDGVWHLDPLAPWGLGGPPFGPAKALEIYERGRREIKRWQYGRGHNR